MKFVRIRGRVVPIQEKPNEVDPRHARALKALKGASVAASVAGTAGMYTGVLASPISQGVRKLGDRAYRQSARINEAARISAQFGKNYATNDFFKGLAAKSAKLVKSGDRLHSLAAKLDPGHHIIDLGDAAMQIPKFNMKILQPAAHLVLAGAALAGIHGYLKRKSEENYMQPAKRVKK